MRREFSVLRYFPHFSHPSDICQLISTSVCLYRLLETNSSSILCSSIHTGSLSLNLSANNKYSLCNYQSLSGPSLFHFLDHPLSTLHCFYSSSIIYVTDVKDRLFGHGHSICSCVGPSIHSSVTLLVCERF